MTVLVGPVAAFTVASLFYAYREYSAYLREKRRRLCERVTYMLWVAANGSNE